jgi:hypothetical protein
VFIKELLLFFVFEAVFIEEFLEYVVSILKIVLVAQKLIVMGSFVSVRKTSKP